MQVQALLPNSVTVAQLDAALQVTGYSDNGIVEILRIVPTRSGQRVVYFTYKDGDAIETGRAHLFRTVEGQLAADF